MLSAAVMRWHLTVAGVLVMCVSSGCGFLGPPENNTLEQVCSVAGASLAQLHPSPFSPLERNAQTVIHISAEDRHALLSLPGCRVDPLPDMKPQRGRAGLQILPGGVQLQRFYPPPQTAATEVGYVYAYSPGPSVLPILVPGNYFPGQREFPILSEDGGSLAVLRTMRTQTQNRNELVLRKALTGEPRSFWPQGIEITWHELVAIDVHKEEIVLARGLREYLWVRFDGKVIRGPVNTGDVQAQPATFRWAGDGWFAWDAYRDAGRYGFRLKTSTAERHVAAEKLRSVNHAAISPDARHAAMSLQTGYGRLLWLRDAVAVIDMASGKEIFRRYLPRFTRSQVAFPGHGFFAYSEPGRVRVLRLPDSPAAGLALPPRAQSDLPEHEKIRQHQDSPT